MSQEKEGMEGDMMEGKRGTGEEIREGWRERLVRKRER